MVSLLVKIGNTAISNRAPPFFFFLPLLTLKLIQEKAVLTSKQGARNEHVLSHRTLKVIYLKAYPESVKEEENKTKEILSSIKGNFHHLFHS